VKTVVLKAACLGTGGFNEIELCANYDVGDYMEVDDGCLPCKHAVNVCVERLKDKNDCEYTSKTWNWPLAIVIYEKGGGITSVMCAYCAMEAIAEVRTQREVEKAA
jgi:hypothetical protein